jgi:hypothetical protein
LTRRSGRRTTRCQRGGGSKQCVSYRLHSHPVRLIFVQRTISIVCLDNIKHQPLDYGV